MVNTRPLLTTDRASVAAAADAEVTDLKEMSSAVEEVAVAVTAVVVRPEAVAAEVAVVVAETAQ